MPKSSCEEIDLTYEGIATHSLCFFFKFLLEEIDLTYEGIATLGIYAPMAQDAGIVKAERMSELLGETSET